MTEKTYLYVEHPSETRKVDGSTPSLATIKTPLQRNDFRRLAITTELAGKALLLFHKRMIFG